MARPTRLEISGATYLVTTHGTEGGKVFHNEGDREDFLAIYAQVSRRLGWHLHFYLLADTHYELLLTTPKGDLSRGMRQLNGVYTQHFNLKHASTGSLFQGRFKALVVDTEKYYKPLLRHLVQSARKSRGRKVEKATHSGLAALLAPESAPAWLAVADALNHFGRNANKAGTNLRAYLAEPASFDPRQHVRHQIYLGDAAFVAEMRKLAERGPVAAKKQNTKGGLKGFLKAEKDPKAGMAKAYLSGQFRMQEIAQAFGVHYSTVSRAVKTFEQQAG